MRDRKVYIFLSRAAELGLFCSLVIAMAGPSIGATGFDQGNSVSHAFADSIGNIPELDEVLEELQAAGIVPSNEDLEMILGKPKTEMKTSDSDQRPWIFKSTIRLEPGRDDDGGRRSNLAVRSRLMRARISYKKRPQGPRDYRGHLAIGIPSGEIRAGDLGYTWGCGILSSAPGRGYSLSAGNRIVSWRCGTATGGSGFDRWAVSGLSLSTGLGSWRLDTLAGVPQSGSLDSTQRRSLIALRREAKSNGQGILFSRNGSEIGFSGTTNWQNKWVSGGWEVACWGRDQTSSLDGAWAASLAYVGSKRFSAEGFLAGSPGGGAAQSGRRPNVLPSAVGTGWALRGTINAAPGRSFRFLMSKGQSREGDGSQEYLKRNIVDFEGRWRVSRTMWFSGRWRHRSDVNSSHSDRYPWNPPVGGPEKKRNVFSLAGGLEQDGRSSQFLFRSQVDGNLGTVRRRKLFLVKSRQKMNAHWDARVDYGWAWGGDADLVSAVSPFRNFVLPRHWGKWLSEIMVGLEYSLSNISGQCALSRRISTPEVGLGNDWTFWSGATWKW